MTTMRSNLDNAGEGIARGAARYPLSGPIRISRARSSGTPCSSSVIGPPGIRSTLMTLVCPTRAHSDMICRSVASLATIDTLPSCMVTFTSAAAGDTASSDTASIDRTALGVTKCPSFMAPTILALFPLFLSEVVDDLDEDVIQPMFRRITDETLGLLEGGDAPGHVLEAGLVGLFVGDALDDRCRPAQLAHPLGGLLVCPFLNIGHCDAPPY